MLKLPLWIFLVVLAALLACGSQTPTSGGAETTVPAAAGAATSAPAPEPTETPQSVMTATPRPTAAPRATPASPPTPEPTATPAPPGVLAPLQALDSGAMLSELSDAELACIGDDPEKLVQALTGHGSASREEQAEFIGCLGDETLARVFLAGFLPGPGPFSQETSDCVRAAFEVIDPRAVMTAGIEGDPSRATAGSITGLFATITCLNDEEWEEAASRLGMRPDERERMQCLLDQLGEPGEMAEATKAAGEGDFTDLAKAGSECGLEMGPPPEQPPGTPPPVPKAASTLVITGATPTGTAATPTPSPTRMPAPATPTQAPTPTNIPSTSTSTSTPTPAATLTITVAPIPAGIPDYDRDDWKHWQDYDKDCQDIRHEVLIIESLVPVTFKTDKECQVATGRWFGVFDGHHLENAGHVDVDHMVPLRNAHISGAWAWSPVKKEMYANFLADDAHLIAVASRANRSKGARGPEEWRPHDETYWCQYAQDWAEIKERWELTMTEPEADAVVEMLDTCENPPQVVVEVREAMETRVGVHKPETTEERDGSVYGSCQEAESAGEQRVQGSQGGGRGFPKAMVPSARDGDGIVCER